MSFSPNTSRRLMGPAIVALLLASSLAPSGWHRWYGPRLNDLAVRALWPLIGPMQAANRWAAPREELPGAGAEDALRDEVLRLRGRTYALENENRDLRDTLAQLQGIRGALSDKFVPLRARVIGAAADAAAGTVAIDRGTHDGVEPAMAVIDGDELALVGRVVQAGPTTSAVKPLASPDALIEVILVDPLTPGDQLDPRRRRTCLLEYESPGLLIARNVDQNLVAKVGDLARLADTGGRIAWPSTVQGMIVGVVRKVEPDLDQPLRQIIRVEPIRSLRTRESVLVIVPRTDEPASGQGGKP